MSALVIFSLDVPRLAGFYEAVLAATPSSEPSGDIRLINAHDEVLIHSVGAKTRRALDLSERAGPRESSAFKPVFEVDSLPAALAAVESAGGAITKRHFVHEGLARHDVVDPDGNVIQLRSAAT